MSKLIYGYFKKILIKINIDACNRQQLSCICVDAVADLGFVGRESRVGLWGLACWV